MSSFDGYFDDPTFEDLYKALVKAKLHMQLDVLLDPVDSAFTGILPFGATPLARLRPALRKLNRTHNLKNGDVPMAQFLREAAALTGGTADQTFFEDLLARVLYLGEVPAKAVGLAALPPAAVAAAGEQPIAPVPNLGVVPEAQTNAYDLTVRIDFLKGGLAAAGSVMKLLVHRHVGGNAEFENDGSRRSASGTGWMIAPGLLITNHHVIDARSKLAGEAPASPSDFALQAQNTFLLFDYVTEGNVAEFKVEPGALVYANAELDFAILRVPAGAPVRVPLRLRAHPIRKSLQQAFGLGVNLLQHPLGKPLRLGFRNNYVVYGDLATLSYLTDTETGSSGAPVMDDSWQVAALHAGSQPISALNVEIFGHKFTRENYGIPVAAILSHLAQQASGLHGDILAAQPAD